METENIYITKKELKDLILSALDIYENAKHPKIVYGIKGLAELLNVSIPKAQNIKNSGVLDESMYQIGRKLAFDANKVLATLKVVPDGRPCTSANLYRQHPSGNE